MPASYDTFVEDLLAHLPDWFQDEQRFKQARMTSDLHPYTSLFSPIQVNGLKLKNRLVMGPMGNISMPEEMGRPSNKMIQYFTERARGGVGLLTTGLVPVSQNIDPTVTELGDRSYFPRIDRSRTVFSGWRILAENIHACGARLFIQLTPGLGRVGSPESLIKKYKLPVSASWNPNFYIPDIPCRPLTDGECRGIIKAAGQAAADARAMLIDGTYLHGHEGYLLEQMTNPAFNRRKLGRYADWQAFGIELVEEIRQRTAPSYPIMYRIDLSLALNAAYGERMHSVSSLRKFRHERTVEQTLDYMLHLVRAGVDLFDVDLGCYDNWWLPHPPNSLPSGCYLAVAKLVKDFLAEKNVLSNAGLPVPVVGVGKLGYPDMAEQALRDGQCDLVMLARPLLADSQWANKAFAGRTRDIRPCIGDQEACLNEFVEGGHPQCSVNPRTGFEDVLPAELLPAARPKKIAILGAGPAGVMAAVTAAARGHHVTLFEKRERIGGMLVPGSRPRIKYEVGNYLLYLERQVEKAALEHDLALCLNTSPGVDELKAGGYSTIIVCAGAQALVPPLPGADGPNVVQAVDLLRNPQLAASAGQVLVVGGGSVGCETAHYLALECGKQVTVIEMLPHFMTGVCTANRTHLIHELEQHGVRLLNCTRVKAFRLDGAVVERNRSKSVPDPYNTWNPLLPENIPNPLAKPIRQEPHEEVLPAEMIILAVGLKPDTSFYEQLIQTVAAPEVFIIGDGFEVKRVFEAVKAGFAIGRTI